MIILSGGPKRMRSRHGRLTDHLGLWPGRDDPRDATQMIVVQPEGQTVEQFEINVIEAYDSFEEGALIYNNADVGGKNSNAFTSGVLDAAGAGEEKPSSKELRYWNPGWNDPIELPDSTENDDKEKEEEEVPPA